MTKRDLPCSKCGQLMWRGPGSLPEGKATCHPCRREANAALMAGPTACLLCGTVLTDDQRTAGNRYCGQACGYRATQILPSRPAGRRYRRFGICRPSELVDGQLLPLHGPCRRQKLSVNAYDDATPSTVTCPWCFMAVDLMDGTTAWCADCELTISLDAPFEVANRATPAAPRIARGVPA